MNFLELPKEKSKTLPKKLSKSVRKSLKDAKYTTKFVINQARARSLSPSPYHLSGQIRNARSANPSPTSPYPNNAISGSKSSQQIYADQQDSRANNNPHYNSFDRTDIIDAYVKQERSKYEIKEEFTVYVGTWNTNGQDPNEEIFTWLNRKNSPNTSPKVNTRRQRPNSSNKNAGPDFKNPDMYVLGFQELDLTKDAYIYANSNLERQWLLKIEQTIGTRNYFKVKSVRLAGIMLCIYVKSSRMKYIKDVNFATVGTGLMNQFGNKGGACVSMQIQDTSICIISSHLAAQMDNVNRRNQDYQNIMHRMFKDNINGRPLRMDEYDTARSISSHDVILWLGDLNYRIYADKMSNDEFLSRLSNVSATDNQNSNENSKEGENTDNQINLQEEAYMQIVNRADQLMVEKNKGNIFENFIEGAISFPPTYKYDIGTDTFDTSEKARQPAWTDRILYRHNNSQIRKLQNYTSHMEHKISDHKPVSAEIIMDISTVDEAARRKVQKAVIKKLDSNENASRPSCSLDVHSLDFGEVYFRQPLRKVIKVTNNGTVPFKFSISVPGMDQNKQAFKGVRGVDLKRNFSRLKTYP